MKTNRILLATLISASLLSTGVMAADTGEISFTGAITDVTCNVTVGNEQGATADGTVTLPTVSASSLATAGSVTGATSFNLYLSGCTAATGVLATSSAKAFFQAGDTVSDAGRLINTASGDTAATQVSLQLLDATSSSVINVGDGSQTTGSAGYVSLNGSDTNTITLPYKVQYYAEDAATAGAVTSTVSYNIAYQ